MQSALSWTFPWSHCQCWGMHLFIQSIETSTCTKFVFKFMILFHIPILNLIQRLLLSVFSCTYDIIIYAEKAESSYHAESIWLHVYTWTSLWTFIDKGHNSIIRFLRGLFIVDVVWRRLTTFRQCLGRLSKFNSIQTYSHTVPFSYHPAWCSCRWRHLNGLAVSSICDRDQPRFGGGC